MKGRPPKKKLPIFRHPIPWSKVIADDLEDGDFPRFIDADGDEVPCDFPMVVDCAERFGFNHVSEAECIYKKLCWETARFWSNQEYLTIRYACVLGRYDDYLKKVGEALKALTDGWDFAVYSDKVIARVKVAATTE